jgi:hypothetical protein
MARRLVTVWRTDAGILVLLVLSIVVAIGLIWAAGANLGWGPTLGTVVILGVPLTFTVLTLLLRESRAALLERVSKFAGLVAFAAAGGYFAFQLASGELSSNLSVQVEADRTPGGDIDWLALKATLTHERHASLQLLDAVAYVRHGDATTTPVPLLTGYYRRPIVNGMLVNEQDLSRGRPRRPLLNAGDQIQLAALTSVKPDEAVVIDVVIVAAVNVGYLNSEQWVSSVASPPRIKTINAPATLSVQ